MLERGSRRQELREAMTCFVFASRTVRFAEEIKKGNDNQEEEEENGEEEEEGEESEEEEAEERKERRDRGQPSSHGVRSTERLIFFYPFSFLPPVPPVGPSVSLSPSVSVEKVAACVHFIFLPVFRPFSALIVHPTSRPSKSPSSFSPGSQPPPPLHVRVPGHSFVESFPFPLSLQLFVERGRRGVCGTCADGGREAIRARRNYGERKVVRLMKSQFSVLPFADFAAGPIGLEKRLRGKNV